MDNIGTTFITIRKPLTAMALRERLRHLFALHGYPENTVKDFKELIVKEKLRITLSGEVKVHHDGLVSEPVEVQSHLISSVGTRYVVLATALAPLYIRPEQTEGDWALIIHFNTEGVAG
jgi:hypothetical protein